MASPTSPTHGKLAAIYRLRPNGFSGSGLNDVTWGTGATNAATSYYEVVIDAADVPDTFKWRKNGGAWTETVSITGSAQTLDEAQTILFAATTGHTLADQWMIGNLKDEATTESAATAQITTAAKRLLNPNATPTFTDTGSETVLIVDHVRGQATFTGNVTVVDVDGNNGYIEASALEKVGYLLGWSFDVSLDMADQSYCGQQWKLALPGQGSGSGSAQAFFIGTASFFESMKDCVDGTQDYFLLQLFNYDPDADQTGDHFTVWVTFTGFSINPSVGEVVKESVQFQMLGAPSFTSNA